MTALAVLRMAEQGQIDLDASVIDYVPDAPKGWASVTIRHLLNHTSGLPDGTNRLVSAYKRSHPAAMRTVLSDLALTAPGPATEPGEAWAYNNFGYELLADAVANVRNTSFETALQTLIFEPAGMRTALVEQPLVTAEGVASAPDERLAKGYNGEAGAVREAKPLSFVQLAAGSIHASGSDMLALGTAFKDGRLISDQSRAEMTKTLWRRGQRNPERGYGLGVMVRGDDGLMFLGHDGGYNGYLSDLEIYLDDDAVLVVMTNLGFAEMDWIRTAVGEALVDARP